MERMKKSTSPKCRECQDLKAYRSRNGGIRCFFYCEHKDQKYIVDYCKEHGINKHPGFVCYGGGLYGDIPTVKTSPVFCPLKKKAKTAGDK